MRQAARRGAVRALRLRYERHASTAAREEQRDVVGDTTCGGVASGLTGGAAVCRRGAAASYDRMEGVAARTRSRCARVSRSGGALDFRSPPSPAVRKVRSSSAAFVEGLEAVAVVPESVDDDAASDGDDDDASL